MTPLRTGRLLAAIFLAITGIAATAAPAGAAPILAEGDAVELANKLADATAEQGICYGWVVQVQDDSGSASGTDQGSSLGPNRSPFDRECTPSVVFVANLRYTSELSEAADSASIHVESTLPIDISGDDLRRFGVTGSAMLGNNDDVALINAASVLPALVAEAGLAPPVPAEQTTGTIPASDRPTGGGSSDRLRNYGGLYALAAVVLLAGIGWFVFALILPSLQTKMQTSPATVRFIDDPPEP